MKEQNIQDFWQENPARTLIDTEYNEDLKFYDDFDRMRYESHGHLLGTLDAIPFRDKKCLEIGIGQGADAEQIVRRGGSYSGLDLTHEAVRRVTRRFELKQLPFDQIVQGSILEGSFEDNSFDLVFSHGVLHHVPDILGAQRDLAHSQAGWSVGGDALCPSLSQLSFVDRLLRRAGLLGAYLKDLAENWGGILSWLVRPACENISRSTISPIATRTVPTIPMPWSMTS